MTLQEIAERQWDIAEKNGWHNKTPLEYLALICSEVGGGLVMSVEIQNLRIG